MAGIVNIRAPEGRFFKVDAEAAGLDPVAIERTFRRLGRQPSWPVGASTAVHALQLDAAKVQAACEAADRRIEAAREALQLPIIEAERLAGERAAEARRQAAREAEDRVALKRAAAQGLAPEVAR